MLRAGVFVEAGDIVFHEDRLYNVESKFFDNMLDLFMQYSSRTVIALKQYCSLFVDRNWLPHHN
jgi:hypothetical protein